MARSGNTKLFSMRGVSRDGMTVEANLLATARKELNQYLLCEFVSDTDEDMARVSENWPYELRLLGSITLQGRESLIFEFVDRGEAHFALFGQLLTCYPADGMSLGDLLLQMVGGQWIGNRDPIDLRTVRLGDETVPPTRERKAAIEALASQALTDDPEPRILEGLYLRSTGQYVGVVRSSLSGNSVIVGTGIAPVMSAFPQMSSAGQLAIEIGRKVDAGELQFP